MKVGFLPHAENCVRFCFWCCDFLFAYEISREPLNGFVPNSQRSVRFLARTSLNVKVKGQGHQGQKNGVFGGYLGGESLNWFATNQAFPRFAVIVHLWSSMKFASSDGCWWCCSGLDDLLSDADLDVTGVDETVYRSLTAPKFKVVQRCQQCFLLFSLINVILHHDSKRCEEFSVSVY